MINWRKSSRSQGGGQLECVEVSTNTRTRLVRDSKDPEGPRLALEPAVLATLLGQIKAGEFDL
ncbi:DUF397 domain-containing protein [Actinomadura chibensis]|uniref:DUF397 domain-containing protein n=1 Tax=Actinomadura chibensis TaxID=392828 RepID=A0A5D0NYU4_9ACTN|nr:DUF397 domain-containing protein [Actinomadura chibensis]TYB49635.1 DUF397 domain-containing protein [Actinomadura chibensis]